MRLNKRNIFLLSLLTLFGFSAVGFLLIYLFLDVDPITFISSGAPLYKQLMYGSAFGITAVANAIWLINMNWLGRSKDFFSTLIQKLKPNLFDIFFYSLCAGVGEEILFRGAIQPHIGIWPTAILFIVLHGYLNINDLALLLYGILMVVVSAGLGYLFDNFGIHAAIVAHFLFDFVMFLYMIYFSKQEPKESELE